MSGAYIVTGQLGSGKSLIAISRMVKYLKEGRRVATNIDILPQYWPERLKYFPVTRIPDHPKIQHFELLGRGHEEGDHTPGRNGLIVLDELAMWMNSRDWAEKGRDSVFKYFLHLRKKRWDIMFLIQDISALDKQVRSNIAELVVYCRRFDRLRPPWIFDWTVHRPLCFLLGVDTLVPQVHVGLVKYGKNHNSPESEKWFNYGSDLYKCYNTEQSFSSTDESFYSHVPPTFYPVRKPGEFIHELKTRFIRFAKATPSRFFFFIGLGLGSAFAAYAFKSEPETTKPQIQITRPAPGRFDDWVYAGVFCYGPNLCDYYFHDDSGQPVNMEGVDITRGKNAIRVADGKDARYFKVQ